jgi:citrate lyase subunit beta/citryl-CoA lyase
MIARAEQSRDVQALQQALEVPVIALVETAAGVAAARELASCADRLALGDQDLALDFGVSPRSPFIRALAGELVLASRLADLPPPLDGITPEIGDSEQLRADACVGREGGFGGRVHGRGVRSGGHHVIRWVQVRR